MSRAHVALWGDGPVRPAAARAFGAAGYREVEAAGEGLDVLVVLAAPVDAEDLDVALERGFHEPVRAIRAALPALAASRGTLVVLISPDAARAVAGRAGPVAAAHALRGFATTLRVELAAARSGVGAALVRAPLDDPRRAADALVASAADPRPERVVGERGGVGGWLTGAARAVSGR